MLELQPKRTLKESNAIDFFPPFVETNHCALTFALRGA
jgi:hypothetical protein